MQNLNTDFDDFENEYIAIRTKISQVDYWAEVNAVSQKISDAGLKLPISAWTIVRSITEKRYDEWFLTSDEDWEFYFAFGKHGSSANEDLAVDARDICSDIIVTWAFEPDDFNERRLATMFKLAFGGAQ